ncbi:MAG: ATP-binding protein [Actinomycetota bacterium]|nr:ATP-binding protein [Actinomycetota bacterium]
MSNFRSIYETVELSMVAVDIDRPGVREIESISVGALTTAAIYGANASGKSNVVSAIQWLSRAVRRSFEEWEDGGIPRNPFLFAEGPTKSTKFEVELSVEGVRYAYELELDSNRVIFESLHSYPLKHKRRIFSRSGDLVAFRRGANATARINELLSPRTLVLSASLKSPNDEIRRFASELVNVVAVGNRRIIPLSLPHRGSTIDFFDMEVQTRIGLFDDFGPGESWGRDQALALLNFADLGIGNVVIDRIAVENDGETPLRRRSSRRVRFVHHSNDQEVLFELDQESEGTRNWFNLIGPILSVLKQGGVLLFDEVDASLHTMLTEKVIELFHDPSLNPYGAQLIFTTHNVSLMDCLNRDEVWITEKRSDGSTDLVAVAEFGGDKVRRSANLSRLYDSGRLGGVPNFDMSLIYRYLGSPDEVSQ